MDKRPTYDTLLKIKELLSQKGKKADIMNDAFCDTIVNWYTVRWNDHPIISMILYEIVKCEQIQQIHVTKILQIIEKQYNKSIKYVKYENMDWIWLDTAIKNGYVLLNTQDKKLEKMNYTKSYLLLNPKNATSDDIEAIFSNIVIVHNISHYKLSDDIKKFIKTSKHDITLQCIKNCIAELEFLITISGDKPYSQMSLIENFLDFFSQLTNFSSGAAGYIIKRYCLMNYGYNAHNHNDDSDDSDDYDSYNPKNKIQETKCAEFKMEHILKKYSEHNIKITFDDIVSFCNEDNDEQYCHAVSEIIKPLLECFDTTGFVLTDTHVKQIFSQTNNIDYCDEYRSPIVLKIFKTFQKKYEYKFSQEMFEYAFINCNYVLFDVIIQHQSLKCTPICVDYAFKHSSKKFIQYLLENKICPTEKHIEMLLYKDLSDEYNLNSDIIRLLINFGIKIPKRLKEFCTLKGGHIFTDFDFSDGINYRLLSSMHYHGKYTEPYKGLKKCTPMQLLRQNFANMDVSYMKGCISDLGLTPDIYCFENTLLHGNVEMFNYSCEHYNYVPSVPIILLCPNKILALTALYKFYPELTKGFNFAEEPDNIKQLLAKYPKVPYVDSDSDDGDSNNVNSDDDYTAKLLSAIDGYELGSKCKIVKTEPIFNDDDKESKPVKKSKSVKTEPIFNDDDDKESKPAKKSKPVKKT